MLELLAYGVWLVIVLVAAKMWSYLSEKTWQAQANVPF